jgi:hypothetical protein
LMDMYPHLNMQVVKVEEIELEREEEEEWEKDMYIG